MTFGVKIVDKTALKRSCGNRIATVDFHYSAQPLLIARKKFLALWFC